MRNPPTHIPVSEVFQTENPIQYHYITNGVRGARKSTLGRVALRVRECKEEHMRIREERVVQGKGTREQGLDANLELTRIREPQNAR